MINCATFEIVIQGLKETDKTELTEKIRNLLAPEFTKRFESDLKVELIDYEEKGGN
jgi:hypothetical protein